MKKIFAMILIWIGPMSLSSANEQDRRVDVFYFSHDVTIDGGSNVGISGIGASLYLLKSRSDNGFHPNVVFEISSGSGNAGSSASWLDYTGIARLLYRHHATQYFVDMGYSSYKLGSLSDNSYIYGLGAGYSVSDNLSVMLRGLNSQSSVTGFTTGIGFQF